MLVSAESAVAVVGAGTTSGARTQEWPVAGRWFLCKAKGGVDAR
jgi:hypothetical protein